MNCPLCGYKKSLNITTIDCGGFDDSLLYRKAKIETCEFCGHVFNCLSEEEIENLSCYYRKEYNLGTSRENTIEPLKKFAAQFDISDPIFVDQKLEHLPEPGFYFTQNNPTLFIAVPDAPRDRKSVV